MKTMTKRRSRSEAEILEHATGRLLKALKQDMLKKEGRVNYEKLRKDGYSERFLNRLAES